jgi:hypothetical protein
MVLFKSSIATLFWVNKPTLGALKPYLSLVFFNVSEILSNLSIFFKLKNLVQLKVKQILTQLGDRKVIPGGLREVNGFKLGKVGFIVIIIILILQ